MSSLQHLPDQPQRGRLSPQSARISVAVESNNLCSDGRGVLTGNGISNIRAQAYCECISVCSAFGVRKARYFKALGGMACRMGAPHQHDDCRFVAVGLAGEADCYVDAILPRDVADAVRPYSNKRHPLATFEAQIDLVVRRIVERTARDMRQDG